MDKKSISYGYIPSKLDGTERQAEFGDFKIPTSFSYQPLMPPVRDQGRESTCVCQTLTGLTNIGSEKALVWVDIAQCWSALTKTTS